MPKSGARAQEIEAQRAYSESVTALLNAAASLLRDTHPRKVRVVVEQAREALNRIEAAAYRFPTD